MRPQNGLTAVIRTDPAPGFRSLVDDELLHRHRMTLEIGRVKNRNKNPVAEKTVQALEEELLRQDPLGGTVSLVTLYVATACLNTRIRKRGLSAREMWTQRWDPFSNNQIPLVEQKLIITQNELLIDNHPHSAHSEKCKAPLGKTFDTTALDIGD